MLAGALCAVLVWALMPTVVSAPRLRQRRPSAIESLTEPPLESSTMVAPPSCRPRANSSKSLGLSAVTMPTALTQPRQFGWQAMRRAAQHRHQCDAKDGANEQHPTSDCCPTSTNPSGER